LKLVISGGVEVGAPPGAPQNWALEQRAAGVIRVTGLYLETGALRADTWAIGYTTNGSAPAEDTPTVTQAMSGSGIEVLSYDLPAQANGTTVKVRLQTRRGAAPYSYSDGSTVLTATADAEGPAATDAGAAWPGRLPEEV
jgi:hypothetical protein